MLNVQIGIYTPTSLYIIPNVEISLTNKYLEIHFHMIVLDIYFCFNIKSKNES